MGKGNSELLRAAICSTGISWHHDVIIAPLFKYGFKD